MSFFRALVTNHTTLRGRWDSSFWALEWRNVITTPRIPQKGPKIYFCDHIANIWQRFWSNAGPICQVSGLLYLDLSFWALWVFRNYMTKCSGVNGGSDWEVSNDQLPAVLLRQGARSRTVYILDLTFLDRVRACAPPAACFYCEYTQWKLIAGSMVPDVCRHPPIVRQSGRTAICKQRQERRDRISVPAK